MYQSTPYHFTATDELIGWFEETVGIKINDTTADNHFNILRISYVDASNVGPIAKISNDVYSHITIEKVKILVKSYRDS
ncbi:MAG: NAD(P)H-dependent oxidoreductase subunit E [Candidatus Adiutrix intracellularis]|nr:NAD(P)H-dependent oxidoreductase subunit E [Candidatus Adiutrix intracellularis]